MGYFSRRFCLHSKEHCRLGCPKNTILRDFCYRFVSHMQKYHKKLGKQFQHVLPHRFYSKSLTMAAMVTARCEICHDIASSLVCIKQLPKTTSTISKNKCSRFVFAINLGISLSVRPPYDISDFHDNW